MLGNVMSANKAIGLSLVLSIVVVGQAFALMSKGSTESISKAEVERTQGEWFDSFMALKTPQDATDFVNRFYAFDTAATIFKPTTADVTTEEAGAIDYFTKQLKLIGLSASTTFDNKAFVNDEAGHGIVYGQFTTTLKMVPPPVIAQLDQLAIKLNEDDKSVTFDYTMGFMKVGNELKLYLHHNVWRASPH